MVALVSVPYRFATFVSYKAYKTPRKTLVHSSIRVPSSSLRRTRRKNYLRPKILRTYTKPENIPVEKPIVVVPSETNVEVHLGPTTEKLDSRFGEESEVAADVNEAGLSEIEGVRESEDRSVVGLGGISGRTVVRVVGSFVGLFVLQTVVSVWIMGSGNSNEKDGNLVIGDRKRDLSLGTREGEVGINGDGSMRNWVGLNVDEAEMEAKITEIRKMAWEVREAERRKKKVENGEAEIDDASDDNDDDEEEEEEEDFESDNSRINSGIVKEVDGRLSKLRKKYPSPFLNVNLMNKSGGRGKKGKDEGLDGKEDDDMLMFKMKQKFRSHLTTPKEKPKGFQSIDGVGDENSHVDDKKRVERIGSGDDVDWQVNALDSTFPDKSNSMDKEEKIPVSQSFTPLKGSRKKSGSNGAEKKLDKGFNGSTTSGSNGTAEKLGKAMNGGAKPKTGLVQDYSDETMLDEGAGVKKSINNSTQDEKQVDDHVASTTSERPATPQRKGQPLSDRLGSGQPQTKDKEGKQKSVDPWWSKLPYVLVILMQKGIGSEAERGFYNIRLYTDAVNQSSSSYTVAFEDRNDAKNFSYLLELAFEDLPDAAVDVAPLSTKDFKEVAETLDNKVIVLRKGELKLYADQPLADAEAALRSLVT